MQHGISVQTESLNPETAQALVAGLTDLLKTAFETHTDQDNVGKLIETVGALAITPTNHVNLSNVSVHGGNQFVEVEEDYDDEVGEDG